MNCQVSRGAQPFIYDLSFCGAMPPLKNVSRGFFPDASVIDLRLAMFNWATFRQTKGAVKLHLLLDHAGYLPGLRPCHRRKRPRNGGGQEIEFCQGLRCGHGSRLYRLQTLRPLDRSRDLFRHWSIAGEKAIHKDGKPPVWQEDVACWKKISPRLAERPGY
jgi:hypothetical protein